MKVKLIDHIEDHRDFVGTIILRAITMATQKDKSLWPKIQEKDEEDFADVVLTINGVELPVVEVLQNLEKNLDKHIHEKAKALVQERLKGKMNEAQVAVDDLIGQIHNILSSVKDKSILSYSQTLFVDETAADELKKICNEPSDDVGKCETVWDQEVQFDNGYRMAIQVCADAEPLEHPCWTQGVLYDPDGNERNCTEAGDSILGEFVLYCDGIEYTTYVIKRRKDHGNKDSSV